MPTGAPLDCCLYVQHFHPGVYHGLNDLFPWHVIGPKMCCAQYAYDALFKHVKL
jgi:hypothetical protein